jgi:hypothetical protein
MMIHAASKGLAKPKYDVWAAPGWNDHRNDENGPVLAQPDATPLYIFFIPK